MSDGEKYIVEMEFKRVGDFGLDMVDAKMRKAERGMERFKKGWGDFGSAVSPIGDIVDGVASKVGNLAKVGLMVGGTALLAGATYGVTNLNNELEKATIGLGVIFNASGVASSVPKGLERAQQVVAQMRVDAQKLPGEFSELQTIFTTAATPAFRSGATIDQLREMSAKAMVAGKVTNMDMGQVAREFTLLLEGRSGSHNTFGSKMGLTGSESKKFNAMDSEKRFDALSKLLSKYDSGLTMFEQSFDAQSSTFTDNVKNFVRTATGPLFETVKSTLSEVNEWFSSHSLEIDQYAHTVGYALRDAFNSGKAIVQEYGPLLLNFTETAYRRFVVFWGELQPYAEAFSASIKSALEDPNGTIDKLLSLGKLWLELKGAGMLLSGGQMAFGAAQGIGGMMSSAGMLGGAASAAGAAGAAGGLGEAAVLGVGVGVAGAGAALIAALGGVAAAFYEFSELQDDIHDDYKKTAQAKAEASEREIDQMVKDGYSEQNIQQRINEMHDQYIESGQNMAANILEVALAAKDAAGLLFGISNSGPGSKDRFNPNPEVNPDMPEYLKVWKTGGYASVKEPERSPDAHKSKGGHGGTIQKVEIVVTSNQNPNRIARAVLGELGKVSRMNGRSPDVTNYGAIRGDG